MQSLAQLIVLALAGFSHAVPFALPSWMGKRQVESQMNDSEHTSSSLAETNCDH